MHILDKLKNLFGRLKSIFTKAKNGNKLRINLGFSTAVLSRGKSMSYRFNGKSGSMNCEDVFFWRKQKKPIFLFPSKEPNPHIIIVGMSGFGKSTLLRSMLSDIGKNGIPIIIFDAHDEHENAVRELSGNVHDSSCSGINIFDLGGTTVSSRISELTNLLKSVYSLGYVQAMKLSQCMWYMYRKAGARSKDAATLARTPTIKDLMGELGVFVNNARTPGERNTLLHLRGRISQLDSASFTKGFVSISDLKHGVNSFSLSSMKGEGMRLIYLHELLRRLYQDMKGNEKERGIGMYIMIDEADFLISSTGSGSYMVSQLIGEGRKYGVGVILATHTASDLNKQIIANASTFIAFYPREPGDVNYISNILSGGMPEKALSVKSRLHKLGVSEAMLISGRFKEPIMLKTPSAFYRAKQIRAVPNTRYNIERAIAFSKSPIKLEKFIEEFGPADETSLSAMGIDLITIDWYGAKEQWLMARNGPASAEHEVYVIKIKEELDRMGINNAIIDNSNGPDIVAYANSKKIAIEYETGRKNINETIVMFEARLKDYDEIIVLVNDAHYEFYRASATKDRIRVFPISGIDKAIASFRS